MPKRTRKQTQDINQFAADVVRRSTGIDSRLGDESPATLFTPRKGPKCEPPPWNPSPGAAEPDRATISQVMAAMGRRGGLKGAATLNARLTPAQRKRSAQRAAAARWGKKG